MQIGDKIRTLRQELRLTQSDLAGSMITRNMLSHIENGSAMPSLDTLRYLASRLGVPAGFLIAEENENIIYRKSAELVKIRESYRRGDWKGCRRLCELLGLQDKESERYIRGCLFHIARDCFGCGELHAARAGFRQLINRCENDFDDLYPDGVLNRALVCECRIYLACLSDISPVFSDKGKETALFPAGIPNDPFALYYLFYRPKGSFRPTEEDTAIYLASRPKEESYYTGHIRARSMMAREQYAEAGKLLQEIAYGESIMPQPVLLFLLSDLEKCYRETGDFQGAYECAELHRELSDSLLREADI